MNIVFSYAANILRFGKFSSYNLKKMRMGTVFRLRMIFLEIEENLSINKTDEKGVVFVTKKV